MKILLLLPDGVGVRNFIYTDFVDRAIGAGHEIIAWADEDILSLIDDERVIKVMLPKEKHTSTKIEILRRSWSVGMLKWQAKEFKNETYLKYIFKIKARSFKNILSSLLIRYLILTHKTPKRLYELKRQYLSNIKRLKYYDSCLLQLKSIKPDLVFCTHQRASKALAPVIAAQENFVPTVCFIFSWDNLPKANLYIESDFYLVWSQYMKQELQLYYPYIKENQIFITGTPQFIPYFNHDLIIPKDLFANRNNIPVNKKWICYSGDDITTSPYDQDYLRDIANSIRNWNLISKEKIHIIFRRCPVDNSNRFDTVLSDFKDVITEVRPLWSAVNPMAGWDNVVAQKADIELLINTVYHSECVINIGSTMAFDFAVLNKPCIYINYNLDNNKDWDIHQVYKNIHFQTSKGLDPVIWITNKNQWIEKVNLALYNANDTVEDCKKWLQRVALFPLEGANERILNVLNKFSNENWVSNI